MPTIEATLRQQLHKNAIGLRKLAYTLPNGVGEYHMLQLSERMSSAADEVVRSGEATGLAHETLPNIVTGTALDRRVRDTPRTLREEPSGSSGRQDPGGYTCPTQYGEQ